MQEIIECPEEEGTVLGTSMIMCFFSSLLCVFGVISFTFLINHDEKDTLIVVALYSILLFFQAFEILQYWFQAKFLSKYTSITMLLAYVIVSVYKAILLITEKSVYWFAVSNAFDVLIIVVALFIIYKKIGCKPLQFSFSIAKRLFAKSKYYVISNMMLVIFAQTDRVMLKQMIDDSATGFYSAAATCAALSNFVFIAIIDSARPSIFEQKKNSTKAFEQSVSKLYSIIIYLAALQSVFITFTAKYIIDVLYGPQFVDSTAILRIIVWYTIFSYMGSVRNIWMLAEGKQKYLWSINLCGALANVLLNVFLIPVWGGCGAAVATLITQFITNVCTGLIFKPIKRTNYLIMSGLNPKLFFIMVKSVIKGTIHGR